MPLFGPAEPAGSSKSRSSDTSQIDEQLLPDTRLGLTAVAAAAVLPRPQLRAGGGAGESARAIRRRGLGSLGPGLRAPGRAGGGGVPESTCAGGRRERGAASGSVCVCGTHSANSTPTTPNGRLSEPSEPSDSAAAPRAGSITSGLGWERPPSARRGPGGLRREDSDGPIRMAMSLLAGNAAGGRGPTNAVCNVDSLHTALHTAFDSIQLCCVPSWMGSTLRGRAQGGAVLDASHRERKHWREHCPSAHVSADGFLRSCCSAWRWAFAFQPQGSLDRPEDCFEYDSNRKTRHELVIGKFRS